MSNLKNILQNFQNINFTQYEAKAYLSLLQHDQVSGYELAKNSGIPASKIYHVLNKLLQREIIVALDTDPVKYAPIPPDQVISRYRNDYLQNIDSLKSGLDEIYNQHQHTDNYIWNISGRQAILNRVNEFISGAKNSIHLSVWDEEVTEIQHTLKDAAEKDVRLHVVHYGQIKLGFGEEYRHGREHQIRQERGARRIALEVDEQKVILGHFIDNGSSNAAWTTNKGLVLLAKDYIIHDIYTIRIAEKFGEAANQIFESH